MGDSSAGHLSREPRQAIEAAPRLMQRSTLGPARDGLLNRQHSADNRAGPGLLRPSQVPLVPASDPPPGSSLDSATRSRMESLLGADFSQVRVHADAERPRGLTPSRGPAYTIGHDVHLVGGQYAPHRPDGTWILAHELAHVAQQTRRGNGSQAAPAHVAEQEARAAADAVSDNKPFPVRSWTGVCLACAPPAPTGPQPVPAQAESAGSLELHFFGEPGESGVGVLYIRGWGTLSPQEQLAVRTWLRDADTQYGMGAAGPRQPVSPSDRATGNKVAALGRQSLGLDRTSASGHVPDIAGGGDPIDVQIGLPSRVNQSIGGQWRRYKHGFRFTGLAAYDESTGQWIYLSDALEHEPPPAAPGPPVRTAPATPRATAPAQVPHPGGSQTTAATPASDVETIAPTESAAAAPGVVSPGGSQTTAATAGATPTAPVEEPVNPEPAVSGTGMIVTTGVILAMDLVLHHLSGKLAESERENIRRGWRVAVAPEVEQTIESLHRGWRENPKTRPTEQTYLVVVYGISFEEQPHSRFIPGGPVYLYQKTDYLRSHISTTPLNERLDPPPDRFKDQLDFPIRQVFAVSIPVSPERPVAAGGSGQRIPIAAGGSG